MTINANFFQGAPHGAEPLVQKLSEQVRRTNGGMNTKPHATLEAKGRTRGIFLSAGHVGDCNGAAELFGSPP